MAARWSARLTAALLLVSFSVSAALAQGFLMPEAKEVGGKAVEFRMPRADMAAMIMPRPRPFPIPRPQVEQSYKIKELTMDVSLTDQIAKVQVSQTFQNTGNVQMECSFIYPLPYDGAVESLTFMVDGKEYAGKLLSATEARTIYESYVRRNIDPALVEWIGTGMFKTSVFPVPPGKERKVTLKYSQLCRKQGSITEFTFPLRAAQYTDKPVERVALKVNLSSTAELKNVYSPSHPMQMERPDNHRAILSYEGANEVPQTDFQLLYDIGDRAVGASILSYRPKEDEEGYFLMLVSPEIKENDNQEVVRKQVIMVVDRSGSMSGKKMEQAKGALKHVLENLNDGDLFNIVAYDSIVETYKPELQKATAETRKDAIGWVQGMYAGGSTNIDGALKTAFAQIKDDSIPSYILFTTDGLPTTGETKVPAILENAKAANKLHTRVFSFGVGYDVNARLLDKLARDCFGQSSYVRPEDDIAASVGSLYQKIGSPVLTGVKIDWELADRKVEQGPVVNRVYPRDAYDLFMGEQLVMVGRYADPVAGKVVISGKVGDKEEKFDFQASLTKKSSDETYAFIERLWATRRVGQIIDEIDLVGKNQELIDELVELSKKHGIMTPYTSFLAEEEGVVAAPVADLRRKAELQLGALDAAESGAAGVAQRDFKGQLREASRAAAPGAAKFRRADKDEEVVLQTVQTVGAKTFFLRGDRWVDSSATEEQLKKAQKIERFSKQYFDLVTRYGKDAAKYLAIEGKVALRLGDEVYEF